MLCSTVFLVVLLSSVYLYSILYDEGPLSRAIRLALVLGIAKPFRAVLAVLSYYGLLVAAVLAFPLSAAYLLLIGFSVPCLLGNFYLRTVLKQFCAS